MEKFLEPLFWFYAAAALIWVHRGREAFQALRHIPLVEPPASPNPLFQKELVTVIIPAKNEEKNIKACVECFLNQDYPNLQILIVNNDSTDQTEALLKSLGIPCLNNETTQSTGPQKTLKAAYLNSPVTPSGWTGKNFAIHTGISRARGSWLLFTDADTRHQPNCISTVVDYAANRDLTFLTLLPRCITGSFIEDMIQPCAMGFLGLWFPMKEVNSPQSSTFFGNGQFLFIQRNLYEKIGGHIGVKGEFLEDFALMQKAKQKGAHLRCGLGTLIYGTRMYDSLGSIWNGWRRIYLHAFQKKPGALFIKFLSVLFFSVMPFVFSIPLHSLAAEYPYRYALAWSLALPVLLLILIIAWKAFGIVKAKRVYALLHPLAALIIAMIVLDAFGMAVKKQETTWR